MCGYVFSYVCMFSWLNSVGVPVGICAYVSLWLYFFVRVMDGCLLMYVCGCMYLCIRYVYLPLICVSYGLCNQRKGYIVKCWHTGCPILEAEKSSHRCNLYFSFMDTSSLLVDMEPWLLLGIHLTKRWQEARGRIAQVDWTRFWIIRSICPRVQAGSCNPIWLWLGMASRQALLSFALYKSWVQVFS